MNKPGEEPLLSLPERHSRILSLLQQNGSISVTQLSELFKVSEVTIRKDLSYLEQQKKLYRTHGSAILISPYISDRHVNEKEKKNVAEKRAIGAAAAALVLYIGVGQFAPAAMSLEGTAWQAWSPDTLLLCKHLIELFSRNVLMLQFHLRLQCCSQFRFNHTINQAFYALFLLKHFL